MSDLVLDSYALLEWVLDQPKADVVQHYLEQAAGGAVKLWMSWTNAGEVYYMLARKRGPQEAEDFLRRLPALPVVLMVPDVDGILGAARIKAGARLAYADAFAVELATGQRAGIITGDPEIRKARVAEVVWIGPGA